MRYYLQFDDNNSHCSRITPDKTAYLLKKGMSDLPLRWVVNKEGKLVDQYKGLSDADAIAEHAKRQQEDQQRAERDAEKQTPAMITIRAFLQRFNADEQIAIFTAKQRDIEVSAVIDLLAFYQEFDLNAEMVSHGLEILIAKELLAENRKSEILSAKPAPTSTPTQ